jgi:hypothetical protein
VRPPARLRRDRLSQRPSPTALHCFDIHLKILIFYFTAFLVFHIKIIQLEEKFSFQENHIHKEMTLILM